MKLNGVRIFSFADSADTYLQLEIDNEFKELLTINTPKKSFRQNRLSSIVRVPLIISQDQIKSQ